MGQPLIDLVGQKFGKLEVLRRHENDYIYYCKLKNGKVGRRQHAQWVVRCKCGKEYVSTSSRLKFCNQKQCVKCGQIGRRLNGKLSARAVAKIKKNAKERGITFSTLLTKEFLYNLYIKQDKKCALSGVDIVFSNMSDDVFHGGDTASLDRIDSSGCYEPNNVQWVDKRVNFMKGALSTVDFVELCRKVVSLHG